MDAKTTMTTPPDSPEPRLEGKVLLTELLRVGNLWISNAGGVTEELKASIASVLRNLPNPMLMARFRMEIIDDFDEDHWKALLPILLGEVSPLAEEKLDASDPDWASKSTHQDCHKAWVETLQAEVARMDTTTRTPAGDRDDRVSRRN